MAFEIEAKLKVDSLESIAESLEILDAEFVEVQMQTDSYFDNNAQTMKKSDQCLRIRKQRTEKETKMFLTYKGRKQQDNFKKRQEIDIPVPADSEADELLKALEFKKALVIEKKRSLWKLDDCLVALDEVSGLGNFIEIEGANDKKIANVQKKLNLEHLSHIKKSYADLIADRKT